MLDLYNDVKVSLGFKPHSPAATGLIAGAIIDTAGYRSLTFVYAAGLQTTTDLTAVPVIKEGSVTGTLTSAAAGALFGTEAAAALSGTAGASSVSKIGYRGKLRYVQGNLLVATAATGLYSCVAVQAGAMKKAVS